MFTTTIGFIVVLATLGQEEAPHRYPGEFGERDGIRVSVNVEAQVFTWLVQNIDTAPITSFEMIQKNCYNQRMPVGWKSEFEDDNFRAWTDDPAAAIGPGHSGEFSTRVSSTGAVLGHVSVNLGLSSDKSPVVIEQIWGPVRKPRSLVTLVAFIVATIAVSHTALLVWLSKRKCPTAE